MQRCSTYTHVRYHTTASSLMNILYKVFERKYVFIYQAFCTFMFQFFLEGATQRN